MALPEPRANQPFCHISALESGHLEGPENLMITDAPPGQPLAMPILSFLIRHSEKSQLFLFDLGMRSDLENYPPAVVETIKRPIIKVNVPQDCIQSLAKGGTEPGDIDYVCLSHCHFDHIGDPTAFTRSTFIVGEECKSLLSKGYPHDPEAPFQSDLLPLGRTRYLSDTDFAIPLGPFPKACDFYGDGSLYIIDSPGHLPGHINVLARTSSDGAWTLLAGDSAHHWKIITGESKIQVGAPWDPHFCIHHHKEVAEEHIARIRELLEIPRVRVLLSHDTPWYNDNRDGPAFWPGKIESL